ncbi:unnamed protein product [Hymenolepis diminuta]|uniref:Uncharacterized protein n=1 Tax=Hymenolepis diminuta TaxID=6216 RepID=A0A564YIE1_HYMDI|nr:unnamed protein product [Hymenolepis diminuta]
MHLDLTVRKIYLNKKKISVSVNTNDKRMMKELTVESVKPPLLTDANMSQEDAEGKKMNRILHQEKKLTVPLKGQKNQVCPLILQYVKEEAETSKMQNPSAEEVYSIDSGL